MAAKYHIKDGCLLGTGIVAQARRAFGAYAVAHTASGQLPATYFPGGAPVSANMGAVVCRFDRSADYSSDALLIRTQVYSSAFAASKGFNLAVTMQNQATPDNPYTISHSGSLTLAVRKTGEAMGLSGDQLASAVWLVPQSTGLVSSTVSGQRLVPVVASLLCSHAATSC